MSSKDNKRYRQMSISESFSKSKRSRNTIPTSTMEQNLRDLLASAAEKRIASNSGQSIDSTADFNQATTSQHSLKEEKYEAQDSDDIYAPSSEELFVFSDDLFPTQSVKEIPPTPEDKLKPSKNAIERPASPEIFEDSPDNNSQPVIEDESETESDDELLERSFVNRIPDCRIPLPKLEPLENHFIMFSPHIRPGDAPRPYPSSYRDKWDFDHVRMPCSPQNKYPVEDLFGEKQIKSRWDLICRSLKRNIETSQHLEAAIMQYNSQYRDRWNFNSLHTFFNRYLSEHEQDHFFETILPRMVNMALDLPNICTQPPVLLKKNKDAYITMTQKQIGCLLLNAFFCTFPRRNLPRNRKVKIVGEYISYPDINFNRLFFGVKNQLSSSNAEKLKCLLNYFRRITSKEPVGTVTFHRQFLKDLPTWTASTKCLRTAIIKSNGLIETEGRGMLQVDFANKFVGGGVLGHGCVQEEIRFVVCPELIVSRLFVECLGPTEVLIVTGVEQYNRYSGYSNTFKWEGNYIDENPRDIWGRKCTQLVAMDATHYRSNCEQYKSFRMERELNKAYCGFYEDGYPANLAAVATGNWGCGAFNGNPVLKFMIQLMAASQTGRDILYFTFGNSTLKKELTQIYKLFTEKNLSVGDLWRILMKFFNTAKVIDYKPVPTLYDFICSIFDDEENTEEENMSINSQTTEITDSEQIALEKLVKEVDEDRDTELTNDIFLKNDPG